jgi:hypothetical protein
MRLRVQNSTTVHVRNISCQRHMHLHSYATGQLHQRSSTQLPVLRDAQVSNHADAASFGVITLAPVCRTQRPDACLIFTVFDTNRLCNCVCTKTGSSCQCGTQPVNATCGCTPFNTCTAPQVLQSVATVCLRLSISSNLRMRIRFQSPDLHLHCQPSCQMCVQPALLQHPDM